MSIEQQPPKHDQGNLPPYPHSDKDTVIPPPEHRDDKHESRDALAPQIDDKHESRGLSRRKLIAGGLATLAVATGGIFGAKALGGGENTPVPRAPEASAPVDPTPTTETSAAEASPTETATNPETALAAPPTELGVEQYRDNMEALTGAFVAQYNSWMTSGTDDKKKLEAIAASDDPTLEIAKNNAATDKAYIDALYVQDWQQLPDLKAEVDKSKQIHGVLVDTTILTSDFSGDPADIEPYSRHYELIDDSTEEIRRSSKLYTEFDALLSDNSDKNRGELFIKPTFNPPHLYHIAIGWEVEKGKVVDGVEMSGVYKIKSINFDDRGQYQQGQ